MFTSYSYAPDRFFNLSPQEIGAFSDRDVVAVADPAGQGVVGGRDLRGTRLVLTDTEKYRRAQEPDLGGGQGTALAPRLIVQSVEKSDDGQG